MFFVQFLLMSAKTLPLIPLQAFVSSMTIGNVWTNFFAPTLLVTVRAYVPLEGNIVVFPSAPFDQKNSYFVALQVGSADATLPQVLTSM
jgi:hypothetical protein